MTPRVRSEATLTQYVPPVWRNLGAMTDTADYRIEHDTMGEVRVPKDALYAAQTQRAVENFPISGQGLEPAHIHALAQVKKAAAKANAELGILSQERADAIVAAADEVIAGQHDGEDGQVAGASQHSQSAPQVAGDRFVRLGRQALGVVHGRLSACCAGSVGRVANCTSRSANASRRRSTN